VSESFLQAFRSVPRDRSLSDKVTEQITEAIVSRQVRPGERLPSERELGARFNVSRTVIREAVRSLVARGLVRVTSGRGVEVSEVNSGDVAASMRLLVRGYDGLDYEKVNEVRSAVEVQTAGLAAQRAQPEDLQRLQQLCDDHQASLERGDVTAASEFDFQFHRELTRASGNELLLAMLDSISDVLREVRHQAMVQPHVSEDGLKAHRRILKCVSAGDPAAAREAMAKHLADAERIWRGNNRAAKAPARPAKPNAAPKPRK
jgi:GntR family transcriptional regulator, transcriptional repressor for pyruvate dehydrogenase complex